MEIKYIDISELKPYAKNPRNNKEAVIEVAESIKDFGFKVPIIIDKNNTIICGHTRYEASKLLKLKQVPCIIATDLNSEQVNAFRLADNKVSEQSKWNYDLLYEELEKIIGIDMKKYGFMQEEINWDDINEIDDLNYEEPSHRKIECPYCHHEDRDIHFKKVAKE